MHNNRGPTLTAPGLRGAGAFPTAQYRVFRVDLTQPRVNVMLETRAMAIRFHVVPCVLTVRLNTPDGPPFEISEPGAISFAGQRIERIFVTNVDTAGEAVIFAADELATIMFDPPQSSAAVIAGQETSGLVATRFPAQRCHEILIQSDPTNTADCFLGDATAQTIRLQPSQSFTASLLDLAALWHRAAAANQTLNWLVRL